MPGVTRHARPDRASFFGRPNRRFFVTLWLQSTPLPKVTTGPAGVVVINVTMDRVGIVGSVSVNPNSTITDEEILDQCKEAALKTSFAYNPDTHNKSTGTIIYTLYIHGQVNMSHLSSPLIGID